MNAIYKKVNGFDVKYELNEYGKVSIYVNGELIESSQSTWYMSELLIETIKIKEIANQWRENYENLEIIAINYIDQDILDDLVKE